jgi:hypothetical protein
MAQYAQLTASAQLKFGPGKVKGVVFSSGTNPTVALYDNVVSDTSRCMVNTMTAASTPLAIPLPGAEDGIEFAQGLYVAIGGTSPQVTIIFE